MSDNHDNIIQGPEWVKLAVGSVVGAAIAIPSIAMGYYFIYQLVTLLGN